jgi:hypothetical protein
MTFIEKLVKLDSYFPFDVYISHAGRDIIYYNITQEEFHNLQQEEKDYIVEYLSCFVEEGMVAQFV